MVASSATELPIAFIVIVTVPAVVEVPATATDLTYCEFEIVPTRPKVPLVVVEASVASLHACPMAVR